ncbi:MAG: hypothetical protein HXS41_15410 [Theionarchaea archaeon]|nr:hypothetical protein [Theionarchaea archaeon]MBU7001502.1 hypothetical protein [Theionarchaea archaeon]MBU7022437.1 hypothetical protein [Theionarchaea archaeon]MBU7034436.1 hypothetical protein [Theionarchaea archaeon]MBU7040647.1 hypothetical protein [Theionarchaea archaeon]
MYIEILIVTVFLAVLAGFQTKIKKGNIFRSATLVTHRVYTLAVVVLSLASMAVIFDKTPRVDPQLLNVRPEYLLMDVILVLILAFPATFHAMNRISFLKNPLAGSSAFLSSYVVIPLVFMKLRLGGIGFMFNWDSVLLYVLMMLGVSLGALPLLTLDEGLRSSWGEHKIHSDVSLMGWQLGNVSVKNVVAFVMLCAFLSMPQNILLNGFLQLYIEAYMGYSIQGLLIYIVVSLLLLWLYFEPVKKGHLRERLNNIIGIVLLALIFYYTRNVMYTMISHWAVNVFMTLPIDWRGESDEN